MSRKSYTQMLILLNSKINLINMIGFLIIKKMRKGQTYGERNYDKTDKEL